MTPSPESRSAETACGVSGGDGKKPRKPTVRTCGAGTPDLELRVAVERVSSLVAAWERWVVRRGRQGAGGGFVDIVLRLRVMSL